MRAPAAGHRRRNEPSENDVRNSRLAGVPDRRLGGDGGGTALGLLVVFATALGRVSPAAAAGGSLTFDPSTVAAGGGKLFVNGSCDPNSRGFVISKAFADQPGGTEFAGVPALAITTGADGTFGIGLTIDPKIHAGTYNVTLRCGGGLAASETLHVLNPALPATGAPVTRLAVGATLVLAVGAGLSMVDRRRPVRAGPASHSR